MKSELQKVYRNIVTIAPVAVLDSPMRGKGFETFDDDGNPTGLMSIRQKCANSGAEYQLSKDGRYFAFAWEFSDLHNDLGKAKAFAQENGITLGGEDFTRTDDGLAWFLTIGEAEEFMQMNSMFDGGLSL